MQPVQFRSSQAALAARTPMAPVVCVETRRPGGTRRAHSHCASCMWWNRCSVKQMSVDMWAAFACVQAGGCETSSCVSKKWCSVWCVFSRAVQDARMACTGVCGKFASPGCGERQNKAETNQHVKPVLPKPNPGLSPFVPKTVPPTKGWRVCPVTLRTNVRQGGMPGLVEKVVINV